MVNGIRIGLLGKTTSARAPHTPAASYAIEGGMHRLPVGLCAAYVVGGVAVWISLARTNPDGLANVGLVLYVFPVTILGLVAGKLIGRTEFLLIPDRFGYLADHAVFFFPSLLAVTALIGWVAAASLRVWRRTRTRGPH
jgi:hypothetical protein